MMISLLRSLKAKGKEPSSSSYAPSSSSYPSCPPDPNAPPPSWTPAPETSHAWGLHADAPQESYQAALSFCYTNPPFLPSLLPSSTIDLISTLGCRAWGISAPPPHENRGFEGSIFNIRDLNSSCVGASKNLDKEGNPVLPGTVRIVTQEGCQDTCLLSDIPIMGGLYSIQGKEGVYYEVLVKRMDGLIALGTACKPYPSWRLPGWNRLSAGLHLDDLRKFFEDPDGGRDYLLPSSHLSHPSSSSPFSLTHINPGDTLGLGFTFSTSTLFFTYNGLRLPDAFTGIYLPRESHDVYAAIGVEGRCDIEVNFGGDVFKWKEGNEWAWRVEGHVGRMERRELDDGLPSYDEIR